MGNINVLSFEVANLIAAGEVVDRPASVLKELLENAIDAGARHITAEIRAGGTALIRVSDDGCGMSAEDLPVSIRRHATSKIRSASDLASIGTLGFRGEALAAIAAVSELQIFTKRKDDAFGTMLLSSGGRVTDISEVGVSDGTTVAVENLFGNVPARRKFLKKDSTETMAATAVVEKIAMSRPDISIEWITDGTVRFRTAGDGRLKNALYAILGRDFANRLLDVNGGSSTVRVEGYVGAPDNVRANRNHQNVFINGRYVKSKTVMAALEKAAVSYVAGERFPVCALFLTLDPAFVDVNVHPAKLEVKFSDERAVFEAVYYAVRTAFEQNTTRPELTLPQKKGAAAPTSPFTEGERVHTEQIRMQMPQGSAPASRPTETPAAPEDKRDAPASARGDITVREALENLRGLREENGGETYRLDYTSALRSDRLLPEDADGDIMTEEERRWCFRTDIAASIQARLAAAAAASRERIAAQESKSAKTPSAPSASTTRQTPEKKTAPGASPVLTVTPDYRLVGEVFSCYLLVERGEELLLIDKHAAHERIIFEELLAKYKSEGRSASLSLLVSLPTPLSDAEYAAALEFRAELERVGFAYTLTDSPRKAELSAIPGAISPDAAGELFVRMCADLADGTGTPDMTEEKRIERSLYVVACKAAIKGGRVYGDAQIAWLVERVMALPDITVCPHGRPIAILLSKTYLDREFDRIL